MEIAKQKLKAMMLHIHVPVSISLYTESANEQIPTGTIASIRLAQSYIQYPKLSDLPKKE